MKNFLKYGMLSLVSFTVLNISCTKLYTAPESDITAENYPNSPQDFVFLSGPAYTVLRDYFWFHHNLAEATTDEMLVPTRGGDWGDGGVWQDMHKHTWTPSLNNLNDDWNWGFGAIAQTNNIISTFKRAADLPGKTQTLGELRAIRAFYYFCMMDHFGSIPIVNEDETSVSPENKPSAEVFNFIENELLEVRDDLSTSVNASTYGRPTRYFASMLLAKMYLNSAVYTGTPMYNDAIASLNDIISSGKYNLEPDPLSVFLPSNGPADREPIFSIPYDANLATSVWPASIQVRTLHAESKKTFSLPSNPWNGFVTLANFYDSYNTGDTRKKQWLEGPQFEADGVTPLYEGNIPLVFNKNLGPDFNQTSSPQGRSAGVRNIKYFPDPKMNGVHSNNDFVVFRLADAYLMKAEAELRLTGNVEGTTLSLVNQIRARANQPSYNSLTLDELYLERGRELAWEGWRRNDMIRFGRWEDAFGYKQANPSEIHKRVFPIPAQQIASNKNLTQNTGY